MSSAARKLPQKLIKDAKDNAIKAAIEGINQANRAIHMAERTDDPKRRDVLIGIAATDPGSMLDLALKHLLKVSDEQ